MEPLLRYSTPRSPCYKELDQVEISPSDVGHASQYLRYATRFYKDEAQRQNVIMELIEEATEKKGEWADRIKPDGCWWYGLFLAQVLELKNMLGLHFSNPIAYFCLQYKPYREYSNFPIVLVGIVSKLPLLFA